MLYPNIDRFPFLQGFNPCISFCFPTPRLRLACISNMLIYQIHLVLNLLNEHLRRLYYLISLLSIVGKYFCLMHQA